MAGGGGGSDGDLGFQIAPMIDLILVLLVFFMSTVALKQVENELGITLPGTGLGKTDAKATVPMNIGIDMDGSVNLNGEAIAPAMEKDLSKLVTKLQEQVQIFDDKIPVIIMPQSEVPHRRVIDVLNACSAAKVKNISFGG
jgi:biopolymer transport protein ExbD